MHDQLPDGMDLVDLGEHRLRDLGRLTRVFQLSRGPEAFPPLPTLDSFPGNLPAQTSSRIGSAMSMDEAISYALANIDPRLLSGPITAG